MSDKTWYLWEKAPGEIAIYPEEAFTDKICDRLVSPYRGSLEECRTYAGIFHRYKVTEVMEKAPEKRRPSPGTKEKTDPATGFMLPLEDFTEEKAVPEPKKKAPVEKRGADPEKIFDKDYNVAGQMSLFDLFGGEEG